jgi:hypothetical protein
MPTEREFLDYVKRRAAVLKLKGDLPGALKARREAEEILSIDGEPQERASNLNYIAYLSIHLGLFQEAALRGS